MPSKVRTQSPPQYSDYTRYKSFLRIEFGHSCTFCDVREPELGGVQSFCVEHYKPQNRFPKLETEYSNLLYACRHCNQWKGSYWPSFKQRIARLIVLNPFLHFIDKHLDKSQHAWRGKTAQGRWNVDKFRLDQPTRITQRNDRANVEATIATLTGNLEKAQAGLQIAQKKNSRSAMSTFQVEINSLTGQIDTLKRKVRV